MKAFFLVSTTSAIAGGAAKTQGRAPAESCRAVADAELAGQPLHALAYPAQRNCFPSIRIRGLLALSRADRGGAGRLSNPPAGGLALLRIASLQLPCGRPELEARPRRARSLGEPQNKCSQRHATASTVVQLQKKIASKKVLVWTRGRIVFPATHTSVLAAHHCPSPAAALSSANFTSCLLLFSKNRSRHQTRF